MTGSEVILYRPQLPAVIEAEYIDVTPRIIVSDFTPPKPPRSLFKDFLIVLFLFTALMFAWLAIRNSTPLNCSDVINVNNSSVCLMDLGTNHTQDVNAAVKEIQQTQYYYK